MNFLNILFVGIGGFVGSVLRYLAGLLPVGHSSGFPYKTLAINVLGSFAIALVVAHSVKNHDLDPKVVLMLKVGLCGGFTTFSTFAYETASLMQNGHPAMAFVYAILSVVLCTVAVLIVR